MKAWKVIFATLVIFCAGLVIGGLVVNRISATAPSASPPSNGPPGNPGQFHLLTLLKRMDRELALTPEQHAQIRKIISSSQERTRELWKPVEKETASACEQIREVLTPEQREKFDAFSKSRPEHGGRGGRGERGDHDEFGKRRGPWDFDPDGATNSGVGGQ